MLPPFDPLRAAMVAADVMAASRADAAGIARRQRLRLTALLQAACAGPLYGPLLAGRDLRSLPLQALPVMHKRELMQRFGDWVADPQLRLPALQRFVADASCIGDPFLGRYTVWESSGSSGEPGLFVQDAAAMAVYDALEAHRRIARSAWQACCDPLGLCERFAFVGATGGHFASTVSVERLRRLNPWLAPALHSVSFLQPLPALVAELNALQPTTLATYPSAAVMLATEQQAGRLHIRPQQVWTGGETLTPAMRQHVEQAFGCAVTNSYGASEFLALASECRCGQLHLNSDWAILEPVDEQGRAVPAGEPGASVLLTNLANHVQPLIRYDLGDRVTLQAEPCACGSPLPVLQVQGRCDDTLWLQDANGLAVPLLPLALSTVLEDDAGLFEFQLRQQNEHTLLLTSAQPGAQADRALARGREALQRFLLRQGAAGVTVLCRAGEAPLQQRSGKSPRVISTAGLRPATPRSPPRAGRSPAPPPSRVRPRKASGCTPRTARAAGAGHK